MARQEMPVTPVPGVPGRARAATGAAASSPAVVVDALPATPPPELWDEIDAAGRAYETLRAQGRELHFALDHDTGRVRVQVCDLEGDVLRTIPAADALEAATTGRLP